MKVKSESEVAQSCPTFQAPPSMGFSRQEYWSGVPLPSVLKVANSFQITIYMDLDKLLNNGPKVHIFKVAYEVKNVFVTCYLFELMLMLHSSKRYLLRSREKWFECGIGVYVARDEAAEISKTEYSSTICYFPFCSSILSLKLLAKSQSSTILFSHYTRYRKGW